MNSFLIDIFCWTDKVQTLFMTSISLWRQTTEKQCLRNIHLINKILRVNYEEHETARIDHSLWPSHAGRSQYLAHTDWSSILPQGRTGSGTRTAELILSAENFASRVYSPISYRKKIGQPCTWAIMVKLDILVLDTLKNNFLEGYSRATPCVPRRGDFSSSDDRREAWGEWKGGYA